MPAMNSFSRPTRLILHPGAAFWPETGLFPRRTPPPFRAGAALDAAGAELQPAGGGGGGRWSFPPPNGSAPIRRGGGDPPSGGTDARHGGSIRRSGVAPISCADAPISRGGYPAPCGAATKVLRTVPCAAPTLIAQRLCGQHRLLLEPRIPRVPTTHHIRDQVEQFVFVERVDQAGRHHANGVVLLALNLVWLHDGELAGLHWIGHH